MFRLVTIVLLATSALAQTPTPHQAPAKFQIIDTMPTYWQFWDAAKDKPAAEQVGLFEKMVVAKYPELYTAKVMNLDVDKPFHDALTSRYVGIYERDKPYVET